MFCILKNKKCHAYVQKHNSNREKQVILLMISNREKREWSETVATQLSSNDNGIIFH